MCRLRSRDYCQRVVYHVPGRDVYEQRECVVRPEFPSGATVFSYTSVARYHTALPDNAKSSAHPQALEEPPRRAKAFSLREGVA